MYVQKDFKMDKNSVRMVGTGVCLNKEELRELVLEV